MNPNKNTAATKVMITKITDEVWSTQGLFSFEVPKSQIIFIH